MRLESQSKFCPLCQDAEPDPEREDGLCKDCGEVTEKYSSEEFQLSLESEEGWDIR